MKGRFFFIIELVSAKALYAGFIVFLFVLAGTTGLSEEYFLICCFIISIVLFTLLDYLYESIGRNYPRIAEARHYVDTLDRIMGIKNIEELLHGGFSYFAEYMGFSGGYIYLLNRRTEEFDIYRVAGGRTEKLEKGIIDGESNLLRFLKTPEDIIFRKKIVPNLTIEFSLIAELERLKADIAVPIFFKNMFMGFYTVSGNTRSLREDDKAALKIFAVKAGSLYANTFLIKEMIKKRELEKENETALRVRKSFFPKHESKNSFSDVAIVAKTHTLVTDLFYDLYASGDSIYFTSYSCGRESYDSLVFMPSIKVMIQTHMRAGLSLPDALSKTVAQFREQELIDARFAIVAGEIRENYIEYSSINYPFPLMFRDGNCRELRSGTHLKENDVIVIPNTEMRRHIDQKFYRVLEMINENRMFRARNIADHIADIAKHSGAKENKMVIVAKCRSQH